MGRPATRKCVSRAWLAGLPLLVVGAANCYSTGDGTSPPLDDLYYPVGLQVSAGGSVLYAVNSDFDLQYNGGTLQSYNLTLIRQHTLDLIEDPTAKDVPVLDRDKQLDNRCPGLSPTLTPLGETCAPPVRSSFYVRDTAVIGAFATDLVRSRPPEALLPQSAGTPPPAGSRRFDRLFSPVRGNASLTWASIERDDPNARPPESRDDFYAPFRLHCGQDKNGRCDGDHTAGDDPNEPGNSRHITMPGEPFGMAVSEDGESIIVTHQSETKTSLFSTGLSRGQNSTPADVQDTAPPPSLQFVLDGVPVGSVGVTAVPHDRFAFPAGTPFPRAAFLQTSNFAPEVDLLRQYPDQVGGQIASEPRPFMERERAFPITVGASGTDSRGIVIDPTPRIACRAKVMLKPADPTKGRSQAQVDGELLACARKPARVFIANRSPAALLIGEIGGSANADANYDPDLLVLHASIPLSAGPSRLYLAPVVEKDGAYALRVFAVCFDSATVFVYDPDAEQLENVIRVGLGPFAMAFDPFDLEAVASHAQVPIDRRDVKNRGLRRYRFGYLASFTNSFIQVIDLDDGQVNKATFERVVFTLGRPTNPKGS